MKSPEERVEPPVRPLEDVDEAGHDADRAEGVETREADPQSDAADVCALLGELGYPAEQAVVEERLSRLAGDPASSVKVAVVDERVVGFAALHVIDLLDHGRTARLTSIAVDEKHRRRGIATALMAEIEHEARGRDCVRIDLSSAETRHDAHALYERLGYREPVRARRFVKEFED